MPNNPWWKFGNPCCSVGCVGVAVFPEWLRCTVEFEVFDPAVTKQQVIDSGFAVYQPATGAADYHPDYDDPAKWTFTYWPDPINRLLGELHGKLFRMNGDSGGITPRPGCRAVYPAPGGDFELYATRGGPVYAPGVFNNSPQQPAQRWVVVCDTLSQISTTESGVTCDMIRANSAPVGGGPLTETDPDSPSLGDVYLTYAQRDAGNQVYCGPYPDWWGASRVDLTWPSNAPRRLVWTAGIFYVTTAGATPASWAQFWGWHGFSCDPLDPCYYGVECDADVLCVKDQEANYEVATAIYSGQSPGEPLTGQRVLDSGTLYQYEACCTFVSAEATSPPIHGLAGADGFSASGHLGLYAEIETHGIETVSLAAIPEDAYDEAIAAGTTLRTWDSDCVTGASFAYRFVDFSAMPELVSSGAQSQIVGQIMVLRLILNRTWPLAANNGAQVDLLNGTLPGWEPDYDLGMPGVLGATEDGGSAQCGFEFTIKGRGVGLPESEGVNWPSGYVTAHPDHDPANGSFVVASELRRFESDLVGSYGGQLTPWHPRPVPGEPVVGPFASTAQETGCGVAAFDDINREIPEFVNYTPSGTPGRGWIGFGVRNLKITLAADDAVRDLINLRCATT